MKKFFLILLLTLPIPCISALSKQEGFAGQQNENQPIFLNSNTTLVTQSLQRMDKNIPFTIKASFPQIQGKINAAAKQFNLKINEWVKKDLQKFVNDIHTNAASRSDLPVDLNKNSYEIDYDVDLVNSKLAHLISIRFTSEGFFAGSAHPFHRAEVFNFDLTHGKVLQLRDIFQPHKNYLQAIAKYSNKKLKEKLEDKAMVDEGTKPLEKNYRIWNLENDALIITFDEYQVAPYVFGPQEIEIPYKNLQKIISPKSPVYSCVKSPESCLPEKKVAGIQRVMVSVG